MEKSFENQYAIELPKLRLGENEQDFSIDRSFFEEFEHSPIQDGDLSVHAAIHKYETHLDVHFTLKGNIILECDRCTEPYPHQVDATYRVIFAYDAETHFDNDDIVIIDRDQHRLFLYSDFYDFIVLEIPLRKVPEPEVHKCAPEVLEMLERNETNESNEEEIDPRWAKLKELKDKKD